MAGASTPTRRPCAPGASASPRWRSARRGSGRDCASTPRPVREPPSPCWWAMADDISVLVVDDHAVVREGLRSFLDLQEGITVAGEAADGAEAVELAER